MGKPVRWVNNEGYFGATSDSATVDQLPPGIYDITPTPVGLFFSPVDARDDELLRFPDTPNELVVDEIERFWTREASFRAHDIPYKRGILLWGPPGSGKSCTLQLIARDVTARGGIVLIFGDPGQFVTAYRLFRQIQPDTPIVVLMEDLDSILDRSNETKILNLLDGIELVDKVVFLATTNYPQKLGDRIVNRPSRFDRRYKIAHPAEKARAMYLRTLVKPEDEVDIERWARDTEGLSLAHLKELVTGVVILGDDYAETLALLKRMKERATSNDDMEEFEVPAGGQYM